MSKEKLSQIFDSISEGKEGVVMAGGRPTKFTPEVKQKFLAAIRAGSYIDDAANFAGITDSLAYSWLAKGKAQKKGEFVEFLEAYKKAQADCRVQCLKSIMDDPSWQSKAWFLERTKPERYSNDRRRHINDILDKLQESLPDEILRQVLQALSGE